MTAEARQKAYDSTPCELSAEIREAVAKMAVEVAEKISLKHDQGKAAIPDLARWHGQQIGQLVLQLSKNLQTMPEITRLLNTRKKRK